MHSASPFAFCRSHTPLLYGCFLSTFSVLHTFALALVTSSIDIDLDIPQVYLSILFGRRHVSPRTWHVCPVEHSRKKVLRKEDVHLQSVFSIGCNRSFLLCFYTSMFTTYNREYPSSETASSGIFHIRIPSRTQSNGQPHGRTPPSCGTLCPVFPLLFLSSFI